MQDPTPYDFIDAATAQSITRSTFLSREDAATYLGLSAKTLATHLKDGPRYHKFFGRVRYNVHDLDSWAKQQVVVR